MEKGSLWITLAGIGMGSEGGMTEEVKEAVARADILLGAERLIEPFRPKVEKKPFYLAKGYYSLFGYAERRGNSAD